MYEYSMEIGAIGGYGESAAGIDSCKEQGMSGCCDAWGYMDPMLNEMLTGWIGSPNYYGQYNWYEQYMSGEMARLYYTGTSKPLALKHLLIYGQSITNQTILSWDNVFPTVFNSSTYTSYCESNAACTLSFAQLPSQSSACDYLDADDDTCLRNVLWGHWPHIDNPVEVRSIIEEWLTENALI